MEVFEVCRVHGELCRYVPLNCAMLLEHTVVDERNNGESFKESTG